MGHLRVEGAEYLWTAYHHDTHCQLQFPDVPGSPSFVRRGPSLTHAFADAKISNLCEDECVGPRQGSCAVQRFHLMPMTGGTVEREVFNSGPLRIDYLNSVRMFSALVLAIDSA